MMTGLMHAHSGLRFLVLLLAVVVVGWALARRGSGEPMAKGFKGVNSALLGLLHLQVLIGLGMFFMGEWPKRTIGHVVMMLAAAALAQVLSSRNKRQATPGYTLPLIGVGGALLLIVGGIFSIGRHPLQMLVSAGG